MHSGTFGSIRSALLRTACTLFILFISFTTIGHAQFTVFSDAQLYVSNVGTQNAPTPSIEIFASAGSTLTGTGSTTVNEGPPMALALGPRFAFRRFVYGTLYAAISTGFVNQYSLDGQSGALTLQSTVAAGSIPSAIIATGTTVYVANRASDSISVFSINQSTGGLTPLQTVTGVTTPAELAFDPNQNLLVSSGGSAFCSFRVQPAGGLSAPMCTPPLPPPVPVPAKIVFLNSVLYMTVNSSVFGRPVSELQAWRVSPATGSFTQAARPISFGSLVLADVATVPNVDAVYVARTGGVTEVSPATSPSFGVIGNFSVVGTPGRLLPDPRGGRLFVTDTAQNQVISMTVGAGGAITGTSIVQGPAGQKFPRSMALFVR